MKLRAELAGLVEMISGSLALPRARENDYAMKEHWKGYVRCLNMIHIRYGRLIPQALSREEYVAFVDAIDNYSGAGLSFDSE